MRIQVKKRGATHWLDITDDKAPDVTYDGRPSMQDIVSAYDEMGWDVRVKRESVSMGSSNVTAEIVTA